MTSYEILEGSLDLKLDEVAHLIVPGRGRDESGHGLTIHGINRAETAATFYLDHQLENIGGVIVPTGYKTPADNNGELWTPDDGTEDLYFGMPEAELIKILLIKRGIGKSAISVERNSFDTVTNFVYAENNGHFPDDRPVAIVAQEEHLSRMIKLIAPRTLRREYLGVVVPELEPKDIDSIFAKIESSLVLFGMRPDNERITEITTSRASKIWSIVNLVHSN